MSSAGGHPEIFRLTDVCANGAMAIQTPVSSVFANNLLVMVIGSVCAAPVTEMIEGSPNVFAEGVEVVRVGDDGLWIDFAALPPGPKITQAATGSPDVFVN